MVTPEDQKESRSEPVEGTGAQRQHPVGPEESSEGRGGLANQVRRSSASGPGSPGQGLKAEASAAPGACAAGERTWAPGPSGVQTHADRLPPLTAGFAARSALGPRGESGGCAFPQGGRHPLSRNLESPEWPSPWTRPAGIWVRRPAPGHSPPPLRFSLPWPAGCLGSGAWGAWARGPLPRPRQLGPFSHLPRACSRAQAPRVGRGLCRGGLRCPRPPGGQRSRLGAGLVSGRRATVQSHRRPQGQGAPAVLGARAAPRRARHRPYRAGCRGSRVGGCRAPGRTWCEPLPCHCRCVSHRQAVIGAATGA